MDLQKNASRRRLHGNDSSLSTIVVYVFIALAAVITLYPFVYVVSNSLSQPAEVIRRTVWLLPKKFTLIAYEELLKEHDVFVAYMNTLWYTVVGTLLNVVFTTMAAYALSIKQFVLRKQVSLFIVITMFISGGIIPTYIIVCNTGLYNSRWSLIIPTLVSAYNLLIARSYFESIPAELSESGKLDGANDFTILFRIVGPVAKPIISVLIIYYAVQHWNEYFNALLYLKDRELKPIQLYLRDILIADSSAATTQAATGNAKTLLYEGLKFSSIIITVLPITIIYPFFQKHFVQGVMVGAVKG